MPVSRHTAFQKHNLLTYLLKKIVGIICLLGIYILSNLLTYKLELRF
jgi:hypothetical protein